MPPRLTEFAARIGLTGLAIAVLLVLLAVQTVRLEGFKVWPLSLQGWKPRAEAAEKTIADIAAAQVLAGDKAKAARIAQEDRYRGIAGRIDDNAQADIGNEMDGAERFIAAGGVRPEGNRGLGGRIGTACPSDGARPAETAGRPAELDDTEAGAAAPVIGDGLVLVLAEDVRICTTNTIKAEAGRAFALEIEAASSGQSQDED